MKHNRRTTGPLSVVYRPLCFVTLCGRILRDTDVTYFPRVKYHGRTIYLCTQTCKDAFLADPEKFFKAHRKSRKAEGLIRMEDLPRVE